MSPSTMPDTTNVLQASGTLNPSCAHTDLHLPDGRVVRIPTSLLQSGSVQESLSSGRTDSGGRDVSSAPSLHLQDDDLTLAQNGSLVIPIVEEQLEVGKRVVTTGKVLLHKTVDTYETHLDEPLAMRTFDIERVMLNLPVDAAPAVRQEGNTTIYPLVEEQLILTKQLVLKEELRVTRRETERRDTQAVTLRREHMIVERESTT